MEAPFTSAGRLGGSLTGTDIMPEIRDDDLTSSTVGHYSVVALIATGGQGLVYRGRDEALRRDVALKVLNRARLADKAARGRLMFEARVLSLVNHPHIARVYDYVTQRGRDFIVMEYVPGATLRDVLAGGPLPAPEVLRLGAQLADGLAAAHAVNVVHCDVKPANIKITSAGELKILDFGIAKLLPAGAVLDNASQTSTDDVIVGTVPYMSPEQIRGEPADPRSDIFSLGTVLYEMATGFRAFPHRNMARLLEAVQFEEPPLPSSVNPLVPLALERVIVQAMQKSAADRQQSALDVAAALGQIAPIRRSAPAAVPRSGLRPVASAAN